jgi:hypothetical protein
MGCPSSSLRGFSTAVVAEEVTGGGPGLELNVGLVSGKLLEDVVETVRVDALLVIDEDLNKVVDLENREAEVEVNCKSWVAERLWYCLILDERDAALE